ncbi:MAG: twin-arginine translocase TatA/TatE family subunit [Anaerolineae bacterium]|jgi:sec-independent protein translocase protein TatA
MFGAGFGWPELLIVAVIILLLFGASKLTDIGSSLGKGIREFRKAVHEDDDAKAEPAASENDTNAKTP